MGVLLEINAGPMAGKVIGLKTGESVTVGRAAGRAQFALPHDTFMSGVHFAVECGTSGCRVQDRKSSNGTYLNGARIQDAMLANGDEIKSGQTIFAVKMVADAKLAALMAPQEVAPPAEPERPPRQAEPVSSSASEPPNHAPEPVAPGVLLGAQVWDEPKLGSLEAARQPAAASEPAVPARSPLAGLPPSAQGPVLPEPPSPAVRAADLGGAVAEPRQGPGVAFEPPARKASELPASGSAPKAAPPVEEPPHLRAIPSPPVVGGQRQRGNEDAPAARAKPRRGGEPPASVAPYIAEKFAERPASRGAGSPRGLAFSVMGWSFPAAPAEWQVQEGFGLQQSGHEEFPSSVAATEELLGGITLQQFVESQISTLRGYLRDPKIEPMMPPRVGGADESMAMDVRHSTKDGRELVYRRIYARSGSSVGVLTVTTLAADLPQVLQSLQPLLDGAAFRATVNR